MSLVKEEAIRIIQSLPENCTYEDIQYHLYVREKVEKSLEALDRGEGVAEEDADQEIDKWLDSLGRPLTMNQSERNR